MVMNHLRYVYLKPIIKKQVSMFILHSHVFPLLNIRIEFHHDIMKLNIYSCPLYPIFCVVYALKMAWAYAHTHTRTHSRKSLRNGIDILKDIVKEK